MGVVECKLGEAREKGKPQDHHEAQGRELDLGEVDGEVLLLLLLLPPPSAVPQRHPDYRAARL